MRNDMIDYELINKQLSALIAGEENLTGILANAAALLRESTGWFWVGFYMVDGEVLRLAPFQGPVACYRIAYGRGVCGTAWQRAETLLVPDVEELPGHIACSSLSRSEIVVPIFCGGDEDGGEIVGVLDIDSTEVGTFTESDRTGLEAFCRILASAIAPLLK